MLGLLIILEVNMNEQITEEFAKKLYDNVYSCYDNTLYFWKKQGYIKQSREEEIREKLKKLYPDCTIGTGYAWDVYKLQKELIEILDKKLEEK